MHIEGAVLDVDYLLESDSKANIRITVKGTDGNAYQVFDTKFEPYFYLLPSGPITEKELMDSVRSAETPPKAIKKVRKKVAGRELDLYMVITHSPQHVPRLSAAMARHGTCYEFDIPFAKRYVIDNDITPLANYEIEAEERGETLELKSMKSASNLLAVDLNVMWFDIEVYNPLGIPRPDRDPVIMISYSYRSKGKSGVEVLTFKKIDRKFVTVLGDEKAMIAAFASKLEEYDIDVITGYNSANFDIKYLLDRAQKLKIEFNISRFRGDTKLEKHGLLDRVKIAGRVHVDMYQVVKFISIVGASESILKMNSHTLKNVYEAISGEKKTNVEKASIYKLWDGSAKDLETLADYNLSDSKALQAVYDMFSPITIELSRTTGDVLSDTGVSTTGQLVDYLMMRYAHRSNDIIPNKPDEAEIKRRLDNPIEGAYVKTPDPGIYTDLAIFDFRGLYPSIIISYNIDPSTVCKDCTDFYESPVGTKFDKSRNGIMPLVLKALIDQRASIKQQYKKNPDDKFLGSRSSALKILSNSFYGYLGYARSRWYSRECAGSVTAYGRQYIKEAISEAEKAGFKVIYGDTDSVVLLLNGKRDAALTFIKGFNAKLPKNMELELEDFYKRGVFVGKKTATGDKGVKKKYALISESGRIKIRGFELVRRDWSKVARDTQRKVLEAILQDGSAEKAAEIVKQVVRDLREGKVMLPELAINTQLRKSIDNYDGKSPELGAAKKAVRAGLKRKDELEHGMISYVITKHGSSISDRAELEEFAKDYDADYYINHQVMPAAMRILKELNFDEDELKGLGTQKKL